MSECVREKREMTEEAEKKEKRTIIARELRPWRGG